jgi:hypothetical protein
MAELELEFEQLLAATFSALSAQDDRPAPPRRPRWRHVRTGDDNRRFKGIETQHRFAKLL